MASQELQEIPFYVQQPSLAERRKSKKEAKEKESQMIYRRLVIVCMIATLFMIAELVGGIIANSLAVLTDAAHLLSDISNFLISIFALKVAKRQASEKYTFGYSRFGVIAALGSVALIWIVTGVLVAVAIIRIINIDSISFDGPVMFGTALFGVVVNFVMMKVLHHHDHDHGHGHGHEHDDEHDHHHAQKEEVEPVNEQGGSPRKKKKKSHHDHHHNENFRAALVHVLGDTFQSLIVLAASIMIWLNPDKLKIADPICTLIFPTVVYLTTKPVIVDCYLTLMEATPPKLDVAKFKKDLLAVSGVVNLHDLHTWRINSSNMMACYHVVIKGEKSEIMTKLEHVAHDHDIAHTTVQVEDEEENLPLTYDCKHDH